MATQKIDELIIGKGPLTQTSQSCQVFASNGTMGLWSGSLIYGLEQCVEYSGKIYRSLAGGNTGNQPDIVPASWEPIIQSIKDGDACFVIAGSASDIQVRGGSVWSSLRGQPLTIPLVDGQLSPVVAFQYPAASYSQALVTYTTRRGSGQGRKRRGEVRILNDTLATIQYSHSVDEIGSDVNCPFTFGISGGFVQVSYTSALEGVPIELKFSVTGWS